MTRNLSLLALALFAGCTGDDVKESGDTEAVCENIVESWPTDGSITAYYRGAVEFELVDPDESGTITSSTITGTVGHNDEYTKFWLTPDAALSPSTTYDATFTYCNGEQSVPISFTTSELGTSMSDPTILVGAVYELALSEARIVEPSGIGDLLKQYLDVVILVGIDSYDADNAQLTMLGALGKEGSEPASQDFCNPSIDFPVADFSQQPHFVIGSSGTTTISVAGINVDIQDLEISGDFAPDGSYFGGGVLSGTIDTRPLVSLVGDDAEEDEICTLAAGLGIACEACSDGGEFCLSLLADSIVATKVDGPALVELEGNNCTTTGDTDGVMDCETWTADTLPDASMMTCEEVTE